MRAVAAQTAMELRLLSRRGENVLVTLIIPLAILLFFASVDLFQVSGRRPVDFLVPGVLTAAILSTSLVSLGIATAYERYYGVLKRLGGTSLTRSQLLTAKILSVLAIEVVQAGLLLAVATLLLDWRPAGNPLAALLIALWGTACFAGLGLLLAGSLRAEATLALANGLYLFFLLTGGIFLPISHLPAALGMLAPYLPATALTDLLRSVLDGTPFPGLSAIVLGLWSLATLLAAALTFRWE